MAGDQIWFVMPFSTAKDESTDSAETSKMTEVGSLLVRSSIIPSLEGREAPADGVIHQTIHWMLPRAEMLNAAHSKVV